MLELKPLFVTVYVERTCKDFTESRTPGGIIVPDNAKDEGKRIYEGVVLFVGPGVHHEKTGVFVSTELKAGDKVMFGRYIPNIIEMEGKKVYVLKETQIYAKII